MADRRGAFPKKTIPKSTVSKGVIPKQRKEEPFKRSAVTARTPPKPQEPTSQANESVYLCQICSVEDNVEKVRCDKCLLWYHFACAKVNSDIEKQDVWICHICVEKQRLSIQDNLIDIEKENSSGYSTLQPQKELILENPPIIGHVSNKSRKSNSTASIMSRRASLALQKLEEERQLREIRENELAEKQRQRDKDYLNQKYSILEDDVASNLSFDDQEVERQKVEYIRQWTTTLPQANNNNLLEKEIPSIDNEIHLSEPQLNSTTVNQQPYLEDIDTNEVVTTVQNDPPQVDVGKSVGSNIPMVLPSWLTNPVASEQVLPLPWLHRYTQSGEQLNQKATTTSPNIPMVGTAQQKSAIGQHLIETNRSAPKQLSTGFPNVISSTLSSTMGVETSQTNPQHKLAEAFNQTTVDIPTHAPAISYYQNYGLRQPYQQITSVNDQIVRPTCEAWLHPITVCSTSQAINQQSTTLSSPNIGIVSHASSLGNIVAPAVQSNQQISGSEQRISFDTLQYMGASQPQSSSENQPQSVFSHPVMGISQSFDANQYNFHSRRTNDMVQVTSNYQSNYNQVFPGISQSNNINQPCGAPPSLAFVQASANNQQYLTASSTSQPRIVGANQQPFISSQPQILEPRQQRIWSTSQAFGYGQQNATSQPFDNANPSGGHSQMYNNPQALAFGQSLTNSNQYLASNSAEGHPPMRFNNNIPVGQQFDKNISNANHGMGMYPCNNNASMMNQSTAPRLTAEQIAARHVMPKDLPQFNGDPRRWQAFISAYENANDTCGFSNNENLGRLQKCLVGDAEIAVKSRLFHKDSVPGVIETLRLLYGRPELIIETMLGDIQKMPAPGENDLPALIKFAISVQNLSATIQHLKAAEHLRNPMLINSIVDKLPAMHRLNWAFQKETIGNVHIGHLGDWLYRMADVASQVVRVSSKPNKKQESQKDNHKDKKKTDESKSNPFLNTQVEKSSTSGASSNSNQSKNENKRNCPACNNNKCNKLVNCKKFKDATRNERWIIVKKAKICGRCFGNHMYYRCQSTEGCSVDGCKALHHPLLHNNESPSESTSHGPKSNESKTNDSNGTEKKTCNSQRSEFTQRSDKFRIVPVMLHYKNKSVRDFAYLDDGSNMTTMEDSLADELDLIGTAKELCVDWAFGQTHSTVDSRIVAVKISGFYENARRFNMTNVRTVKHLHLPTQSITTGWIDQYSHLKNVPIVTYESAKPRLLIGLQYSKLTVSLETIEGKDNEPIVCKTRLGWVVQGPTYETDQSSKRQSFSVNMCVCQSNENKRHDNELHQLVKDYFSMEHLGVKVLESDLESNELQRAKKILDSTTIKKDGRYETGLLWKSDEVELPESYHMALKRLICLEAKMAKNPDLKANLSNQIKQFVEKGYIRKLSEDEIQSGGTRIWYLPTFPVFNPKKPEKVRLVWDGAATVKNVSLNSNLLVGPDQLVPLPELLRRFREREVAVTGDITEMYHQVRVRESDQHSQRFLWREDSSKEPEIYIMMVMTFGSKCSPSSAQYVKNKNAREFQDKFPRAAEAIIENHYVDDMIDCTDTVDEAETLVNEVKLVHQAGGFNIRNFTSNSDELLKRIGEKQVPTNKNLNIGNELSTERVLGMFWDTSTDSFTYSLKFTSVNEKMLSGEYCPTKREVLRILMSVFDPLGLLSHFLVHGKILLQEIWRSKIEWDDRLTLPVRDKWFQWVRALPSVEKLHIPRWYSTKLSPTRKKSIQLHTFVDAGAEACCATTYIRIEDEYGVDCALIGSKTKVAPTIPMSVPRLELQAAVIGTRLAENVKISQRLHFEKHIFWSDSQTVMAWINSETRRYSQFVAFRIGEILESTEPSQWRWVPTKHNVADEATKSKAIPKLEASSRWFKAPSFLYDDERSWIFEKKDFTTKEELRPCFVMSCREIKQQQLIDLDRFSQWKRLVHTQAYVLRFVHNVMNSKETRRIGLLSQEELIQAEQYLYQRAQQDVFIDEILILKHNEKVPPTLQKSFEKSSELRTLSPYLDEANVLRHKGRIDAAHSISNDTKRPIILPRRHQVTTLLVDWYHRRYKHLNHQTALNEIRQKYFIPALRVVMKGVRTSCQKCKNASAVPRIPEMAGLPPARLATFTRPFTFSGVDYFGPYSVKINRSVVPRYGVIFTCMTTRAIHLEVADTLNTSSCINAVRRFSARKGQPREFFSDNGTNMHGADNELKKEFEKLDQNLIQQEFTSTEQKWTFNPPTASHMGGVWERLIQTVKKCLKQMLDTKTPTQEMLVTLMAEVENIVNSRPLTYIALDTTDDEALTPNHFLFGTSNALKPIAKTTPGDLTQNDWRAVQEMTKHFWRRFVLEYLPDLTKRTKWLQQVEPIKVGDIVLVIDERFPRNTWPKGIVEETFVAKDGCIRRVMVRFGKRTLPVSKLAILDVKPPNKESEVELKPMESLNGGKDVVQRSNDVNTDPIEPNSAVVLPYEMTGEERNSRKRAKH